MSIHFFGSWKSDRFSNFPVLSVHETGSRSSLLGAMRYCAMNDRDSEYVRNRSTEFLHFLPYNVVTTKLAARLMFIFGDVATLTASSYLNFVLFLDHLISLTL